jgi:serine/threonine protein kinase
MGQVLDALQWMHRKGVLHRYMLRPKSRSGSKAVSSDMKPENVLLDSDMRVKITDFGTSKNFDEKDACTLKPLVPVLSYSMSHQLFVRKHGLVQHSISRQS